MLEVGSSQQTEKYPEPPVDTTHAAPALVDIMRGFFAAKNSHHPEALIACFADGVSAYADGTLGWVIPGREAIRATFAQYLPKWGEGRSYPIRILGNATSALVIATDTPKLFGGEIHQLSAVDLKNGKVMRWVDYWDSSAFPSEPYHLMAKHGPLFPSEFGTPSVEAEPRMTAAVGALHSALTQEADLGDLLTFDVVWEDVALRAQVIGRSAVGRMVGRSLNLLPFGRGASTCHIVGGSRGL